MTSYKTQIYLSPLRFINHILWSSGVVAYIHKNIYVEIFIDTLVKLEKYYKSQTVSQ